MFTARKSLALARLAGISSFGLATNAHADETRVRQASQNTVVKAANGCLQFTVSGFANHRVVAPFVNATVGQIAANPSAYGVWDVVYHSGGQFSLRFLVPTQGWYANQLVCVFNAAGAVIDADPIKN